MKLQVTVRVLVAVLLALAVASLLRTARALPTLGTDRPELVLRDAWDRSFALSRLRGMPILVVYEDKESATQNQRLKDELARLAQGDRYKRSVGLVAVADVTGYDYWPVRGFVKDAIQEESGKQHTTIYCDWDGHVRSALGLEKGASNVLLFDRSGKVVFASSGPMSDARREELVGMLRHQVDG